MNNSEKDKNEQLRSGHSSARNPIPVVEEHLNISKQVVETGKVHISKKVVSEEVREDIPVFQEEVSVERIPVNQYIEGQAPAIRLAGETTIIPVIREVLVKRLLLVEELHITKKKQEKSISVNETLRRDEVTVTREDPQGRVNL